MAARATGCRYVDAWMRGCVAAGSMSAAEYVDRKQEMVEGEWAHQSESFITLAGYGLHFIG
jgi:hypothetical protein